MNTPQSFPNKITVVLTKDHFLQSDGYHSNSNCALAVALQDHFETPTPISVGGTFVRIGRGQDENMFDICDKVAGPENDLISDAYDVIRGGGEIEPFTVDLFKRS